MSRKDKAIAIFCSDFHASLTPPPLRAEESDWLEAMMRPWGEVETLVEKHKCPVFFAGDMFHKWNSPPELINHLIDEMPLIKIYAIPGQHDLPEHNLNQLYRSAYGTLLRMGRLQTHGSPENLWENSKMIVWGFPYGTQITPCEAPKDKRLKIALIHQYNWIPGHVYQVVDDPAKMPGMVNLKERPEFEGYDLIVSGDNHDGFFIRHNSIGFINCGCMMRRRRTEMTYHPSVWLLREDGAVRRHMLDTSKDIYCETEDEDDTTTDANDMDLPALIGGLRKLGQDAMDFAETLRQQLEMTRKPVRQIAEKALEKGEGHE